MGKISAPLFNANPEQINVHLSRLFKRCADEYPGGMFEIRCIHPGTKAVKAQLFDTTPEGFDKGYYIRPTVFGNVTNDMTIAREEIFGPVLAILGYEDDADAVRIANDTEYGLSGYVSGEPEHAERIARQLRTGMVHINGAGPDFSAPFGGYKKSGNGREWGVEGFEEYLETKSMMGAA